MMQHRDGDEPGSRMAPGIDFGGWRDVEGVWLVLGGGGVKGLAHVGAWRAVREAGLRVEGILGTSVGALVGAAIASGVDLEELEERARRLKRQDIVRLRRGALWVNGVRFTSLFRGDVLRGYIEEILPIRTWDEFRIPVQVSSLELRSGTTEWFGTAARTEIEPVEAIYASAAVPGLYPPAEMLGGVYVDGAAGEGLALHRAHEVGATAVLGVDVGAEWPEDPQRVMKGGMVAICRRILSIRAKAPATGPSGGWDSPAPIVVRPTLDGCGTFDFGCVERVLAEGYRATQAALDRVLEGPPEELAASTGGELPG